MYNIGDVVKYWRPIGEGINDITYWRAIDERTNRVDAYIGTITERTMYTSSVVATYTIDYEYVVREKDIIDLASDYYRSNGGKRHEQS